jgi:hypothetical protein
VTHAQRWHAHHKTAWTGPLYQKSLKSLPVQKDDHFLTVARYVERNALRAKFVERAEDWPVVQLVVPIASGGELKGGRESFLDSSRCPRVEPTACRAVYESPLEALGLSCVESSRGAPTLV